MSHTSEHLLVGAISFQEAALLILLQKWVDSMLRYCANTQALGKSRFPRWCRLSRCYSNYSRSRNGPSSTFCDYTWLQESYCNRVLANEVRKDTDKIGISTTVEETTSPSNRSFHCCTDLLCRRLHSEMVDIYGRCQLSSNLKRSGGRLGKAASKINCPRYDTTSEFVNPVQGPKSPSTPYCVKGDFDNLAKPSRFPSTSQC